MGMRTAIMVDTIIQGFPEDIITFPSSNSRAKDIIISIINSSSNNSIITYSNIKEVVVAIDCTMASRIAISNTMSTPT